MRDIKSSMRGARQARGEVRAEGIEAIKQAPFLTDEQKREFLYQNAARFLRLEEQSE